MTSPFSSAILCVLLASGQAVSLASGQANQPSGTGSASSLERGVEALEEGRLEEAYQILLKGLEKDRASGGKQEYEFCFYLGLSLQEQADEAADPPSRSAKLGEAASFYGRAAELNPERGAILNNLAQVYADLGREAEAEQLFERAVVLKEPLRPFFHRNYGDFLIRRGDWERAAENFRQTLEEKPDDRQAHTSLVEILSQHHPETLPEYLWFLIGKGQMLQAEGEVLDRLETGKALKDQRQEYLTILVVSLAEQSYLPEEFSSSRAARVLKLLSDEPDIGEGAREVLRLHEAQDFHPESYRWWAEADQGSRIFVGQPAPRQDFRQLVRALGETYRKVEHYDMARNYFRLSILLTPAEPDLVAFRMLVTLPSSSEDIAAIDRMAEGTERQPGLTSSRPPNLTGFGETTAWQQVLSRQASTATQADLYFYRHDLGLFYGFLNHWEGEGPASGIYQLSQATHMGGVGPPDGPPDTPTFDARIYTRLASGYDHLHNQPQARQTLKDLVAAYRDQGMTAEANALEAMLNSGWSPRRPPQRRREVFDDPPFSLRDFTTQPPGPPQ
jgi:tetratricopeptide (TPR) repeat protein